jgi:CxxC-x17-CxxC domain-containing protein
MYFERLDDSTGTAERGPMNDERHVCTACGADFVFTEAEQAFFAEKKLVPPKRCKPCRQARKLGRSSSGLRPAFTEQAPAGTRSGLRRAVVDERPSYPIKCVECGANAKVPFKPLEGRPVFCPACYRARKGSARQATDGDAIDDDDSGIIE